MSNPQEQFRGPPRRPLARLHVAVVCKSVDSSQAQYCNVSITWQFPLTTTQDHLTQIKLLPDYTEKEVEKNLVDQESFNHANFPRSVKARHITEREVEPPTSV